MFFMTFCTLSSAKGMDIIIMKRKMSMILPLVCLLMVTTPLNVFASSSASVITETERIQPRRNITGYKYKILNGHQWKRLWSYTYNRWEDPAWTLA